MNSASVAFRVDAGPEIGLGHLQRCAILARHLRNNGWRVGFVVGAKAAEEVGGRLGEFAISRIADNRASNPADREREDAEAVLAAIGPAGAGGSWVIVDHYSLGDAWERAVRAAGHRVAVIDDYRDRRHHADLLISDSPAPFEPALNSVGSEAQFLAGREYALIEDTRDGNDVSHPHAGLSRILITYGAADATGETAKAIEAIATARANGALDSAIPVDIAIGPFNREGQRLAELAGGLGNAEVHVAPASLTELMRAADLVLTAAGNSLGEALALGRACLATITADNQLLSAKQLAAEGLIELVGEASAVDADNLARAIQRGSDHFVALARRVAAKPPFDRRGAARIAAAMAAIDQAGAGSAHRAAGLGGRP